MSNLEKLISELKKNDIGYYTRETQLIINAGYEITIGLPYMRDNIFQVFIRAESFEPIILDDIEEIVFGYAHNQYPQLKFWNAFDMVAKLRLK